MGQWLLKIGGAILTWALGRLFGGDKPSAEERLGQQETIAAGNQRELNDAKHAIDASRAASDADDAGGVRQPHAGDRKWNPDDIG